MIGFKASGGSQPRNDEDASHFARRGKNAEAFLIYTVANKKGFFTEQASIAYEPALFITNDSALRYYYNGSLRNR